MAGKILQEIRQSKPMAPAVEAMINIQRTASVLRDVVESASAAGGLRQVEYNVLRILRGAGEAGLPLEEIRARLIFDEPALLGITGLLAKRGLTDRAGQNRVITAEGLALLATVERSVDSALEQRLGRLSSAELAGLVEMLERLRA
jgi:DNA-binding MarR family transcriptional regulator